MVSDVAEFGDKANPEKRDNPRLLVVFPCLNEEACLEKLALFFLQDLRGVPAQFVIVDGGSRDQTPVIAQRLASEYPAIHFLKNPKKLQSAAINLAVQTFGSDADYLIRIDVHADYPPGYCQTLVSEAGAHGADSVVVSMNTEGRVPFQQATAIAQNSLLGNGGSSHRQKNAVGCWVDHGHHALISIKAFQSVGGYDESFSHNEDAELDYRLTKAGHRIWLTTATSMTYYPRSTPSSLFMQYYHYGYGRAHNIAKNHIRPKPRQLLLILVAPTVALACLAPFNWLFAAPLFLWAAVCLGYGVWLGHLKRGNPGFLIGFSAMIMHLSWSVGFLRFIILERFPKRPA